MKEQNISQIKKLIDLQNKNDDLKSDLKTLRHESEKCLQSLTKLNDSEFKFIKMLKRQKGSNDKHGIGYNNATHNYKSQTTFVKSAYKHRRLPIFSFCCKEHFKFACPYKRKDNYIIKNTIPFELCEQIKQIWVPKGTRPPNMVYPEYGPKFVTWIAK